MMQACSILAYHRVAPLDGTVGDAFTIAPDVFRHQMQLLRDSGRVGIDLDHFVDRNLSGGARPVVLTFDDGFASNREFAWPVLAELGFRATTFIVTGRLGGHNDWDPAAVPRYPLLTADDCTAARAPMMSFHSHSVSHHRLSTLSADAVRRELVESRQLLSAICGRAVDLFAYPFGVVTVTAARALRAAGYRAACSCIEGENSATTNPLLLRRVVIENDDVDVGFLKLVAAGRKPGLARSLRSTARGRLLDFAVQLAGRA
jgi:peptidoglycan/xylan/chitin deacetylase (PgdA/CDA1 family)